MPVTHFLCEGKSYPISEVLKETEDFGMFCGLPYPSLCIIADAVARTHSSISVTGVLGCLRKAYYIQIMDYSVNPIWTLQAAYGTGLHAVLENSETNAWKKEVQVSYEKDGVVLTGIIDAVRPIGEHTVHLIDFKFPGQQKRSLIRGDKNTDEIKGYKDQLTSYAALYEQQYGDKVVTASIIFMPTSSKDINMIRTFDVPLTAKAIDMALQKLMARAKVLKEAFDTNIAPGYVESDCLAIFCPPECKAVCELNRQEEMIDG